MRKCEQTLIELDASETDLTDVFTVDWKEAPEDVLETIDEALEEHNLEVETIETGSDSHAFRIVRRHQLQLRA
jgi:hypothetical protein